MSFDLMRGHFRDITDSLLAKARISARAGSPTATGENREYFIKEFLETHIPQILSIGSGTIIDSTGTNAGNVDIVLYRKDFPRLNIGKTDIFFVEGVHSAFEVKSNLNKDKLEEALEKVIEIRKLKRKVQYSITMGAKIPDSPRCHIVAYGGQDITQLASLMQEYFRKKNWDREHCVEMMPDTIIVLGQGAVFKRVASMLRFNESSTPEYTDTLTAVVKKDTLALLFLDIMLSSQGFIVATWDWNGYIKGWRLE